MSQDDFDGKRLRKSVMRKTVDYNSSIVRELEVCIHEQIIVLLFWNHHLTKKIWLIAESDMATRLS